MAQGGKQSYFRRTTRSKYSNGGGQPLTSSLLRPKRKEKVGEKRGGKGGQETAERPPPPVYKFHSFSPSIYRGHRRQEEGEEHQGLPPIVQDPHLSRASSWLISSSSTTSQGYAPTALPLSPFSEEICWLLFVPLSFRPGLLVWGPFSRRISVALVETVWDLGWRLEFTLNLRGRISVLFGCWDDDRW